MKNKKVVALLLAAVMSLGCLAGCGNEPVQSSEVEKETQKTSESVVTESTEEVVELEDKTIQIWLMGPGKQKDSDKVWEVFNEKLQEYVPNTTVEFTIVPKAEYKDSFNRLLAAGEKVDLAWVGWLTSLQQDMDDGNLLPLDDLLAEYGQGIIDTLGEEVMDMHTNVNDGKTYYTVSWQGLVGLKSAFWMPTELVDLAGEGWLEDTQEVVTKWWSEDPNGDNFNAVFDQFDIYLAACKDAGKLYSGLRPNYDFTAWAGRTEAMRNLPDVSNVVVRRNSENQLEVIDGVQTESRRVYAQRMAEFYEKGYIRSDIASVDQNTLTFVTNGEYTDNTVVMWSHNVLTDTAKETKEAGAGVELSFIDREPAAYLTLGNATAMAVPYSADEPERAIWY